MTALQLPKDQIVRLALNPRQAAGALGVSLAHFKRHIQPEVRCVYSGRVRLYRINELERWLRDNEAPTVHDQRRNNRRGEN
jgi:hypothetical protein